MTGSAPDTERGNGSGYLTFAITGLDQVSGGIASNNWNVLLALGELAQKKGLRIEVASLLESAESPSAVPTGMSHRGFGGSKARFAAHCLSRAPAARLMLFDHVTLALPVLPLAATRIVKTAILAHGSEAWKRVRRASRWSFRAAKLTVTNSAYTLRKMRHTLGPFAGAACPLALPTTAPLHRELPDREVSPPTLTAVDGKARPLGPRALLTVARMDPAEREKGHRELLAALPELRIRHPQVELVFVGPGEDRTALAEIARQLGVDDAVFIPGWLSDEELNAVYRSAFAFTMPSRQEGFGIAFLEAMNFGLACLGCSDQGNEEVIVDGETGYLVGDVEETRALLDPLDALLSDPARTAELGARGFERLHRHFLPARYANELVGLLEGVLR